MTRVGGGFWEGGITAVEGSVGEVRTDDDDREGAEWEKEAVGTLESLAAVGVDEGYGIACLPRMNSDDIALQTICV